MVVIRTSIFCNSRWKNTLVIDPYQMDIYVGTLQDIKKMNLANTYKITKNYSPLNNFSINKLKIEYKTIEI